MILAATNHPTVLDNALYRRFDDMVSFTLPSNELAIQTMRHRTALYVKKELNWTKLGDAAEGLSYAEITQACMDTVKEMIIQDRNQFSTHELLHHLNDRCAMHQAGIDLEK